MVGSISTGCLEHLTPVLLRKSKMLDTSVQPVISNKSTRRQVQEHKQAERHHGLASNVADRFQILIIVQAPIAGDCTSYDRWLPSRCSAILLIKNLIISTLLSPIVWRFSMHSISDFCECLVLWGFYPNEYLYTTALKARCWIVQIVSASGELKNPFAPTFKMEIALFVNKLLPRN